MPHGTFIVIDLGKTLSKVSLWSRAGAMLDRQVRPTNCVMVDGLSRLDTAGIGAWLVTALAAYADHPVKAIVPVGHGAGVVALSPDGPAVAPLDYEQALPGELLAEYRALRDSFAQTGSPALPGGLNFGAQLFWLDRLYPAAMAAATLLPWAQYWASFLTGRAVSEVTSLGCHSDLWCPAKGQFSPLAERQGWAKRFAPLAKAGDTVGTLRPEIAARTGLSPAVRVLAGLHDSNAALLAARGFAEIADHEATVLSTGTWFIAIRLPSKAKPLPFRGGEEPRSGGGVGAVGHMPHPSPSPEGEGLLSSLPEARDCLVNVDAYGASVPSARFMGGREIESVIGLDTRRVDIKPDQPALLAAVARVLVDGAMRLPTLAPGCGPYPGGAGQWINQPADWYEKRAAMCLYAALVANTSLSLIGTRERLLVEGRFAEAEVFVRALASLRPDLAVYKANAHNDVSFGALRLIDPDLKPQGELVRVAPLDNDLTAYQQRWTELVETKQ